MTNKVLVLGASGKIGRHSADVFEQAGWNVHRYNRKTENMSEAANGASLIINGLNPPAYKNWETEIPRITEQVIAAAQSSGATVIIPGNVYVYARSGGVWSEDTPHAPETRKGKIRTEMEAAYKQSGVATLILRAGDFIDPNQQGTLFDMLYYNDLHKGKITALGAPHIQRQYTYVPDWARAALALTRIRNTLEPFEEVAMPGPVLSINEIRQFIEVSAGSTLKTIQFPWWFLHLAAPFWTLGREMLEMRYLFDRPHYLDTSKFYRLLPDFQLTPERAVLQATLPRQTAQAQPEPAFAN
ncbi:NAD-dependent epimerase/dehydratase family protein [Polycladidibacter hongkongensis]|uniref:NAD-dependent epimerase/dehydratase family protein n=1 Tax=Polycladidibacter hongkongensis TaxID=1647556 RepID=UPI0008329E64|nr:NAD-dependent epimerase/dehydratase family protein [Pseudovibrio hongkongensis]